MRRWVNTKVVCDIETGTVLEKKGYFHSGAFALCTNVASTFIQSGQGHYMVFTATLSATNFSGMDFHSGGHGANLDNNGGVHVFEIPTGGYLPPADNNQRSYFAPVDWTEPFALESLAGNLFSQALTSSMSTFNGTLVRQTLKALASGMSTFAATLIRNTLKSLAAGMSTFAGALSRLTQKALAAGMSTFAGLLVTAHIIAQTLGASMSTFAGALSRSVLFVISPGASMSTFSGIITRQTLKSLAASMSTFAGSALKQTARVLTSSMSTFGAVLVRSTLKVYSSSMSTFAALLATTKTSNVIAQVFNASMSTFSGSISRMTSRTLSAVMSLFKASFTSDVNVTVEVTRADGSRYTYPGFMAGVSTSQDGKAWMLSLIPFSSKDKGMLLSLESGDSYQCLGNLPNSNQYEGWDVIKDTVLPIGKIIRIP